MRSDLDVARYAASASTGVESVTLEVIQGAAGSSATAPDLEYPPSIADGAATADYPVVRVTLDGLTPTAEWLVKATVLPAYYYDSKPAEADVPSKPSVVYVKGGAEYIVE